jgi:hypothetical protein
MADEDSDLVKELGVGMTELERHQCTLRLVEQLKWSKTCLFSGRRRDQEGGITDFTACLDKLGDCDSLIFCEPHRTAEQVHNHILETNGRMFHGERIVVLSPTKGGCYYESELHTDVLFPCFSPLGMPKLLPEWVPAQAAPDRERLWGHHAKLDIETGEKRKPLDLVHLNLAGEAFWLFCLQLHVIRVARLIADAPAV